MNYWRSRFCLGRKQFLFTPGPRHPGRKIEGISSVALDCVESPSPRSLIRNVRGGNPPLDVKLDPQSRITKLPCNDSITSSDYERSCNYSTSVGQLFFFQNFLLQLRNSLVLHFYWYSLRSCKVSLIFIVGSNIWISKCFVFSIIFKNMQSH